MNLDVNGLVNAVVAPLAVALIAWILKDVVVGLYVQRKNEARKEWLFRLREIYSPLFFWSAVVMFRGEPGKDKLGVAQLTQILSQSVSLLPAREYLVFVKLLEQATGQVTTTPSKAEILKARDFVYSRIEVLNFVLFRAPAHFNPENQVNPFAPLRTAWRLTMEILVQLSIWFAFASIIAAVYWYGPLVNLRWVWTLLGIIAALVILEEILRRRRQYRDLTERMKS